MILAGFKSNTKAPTTNYQDSIPIVVPAGTAPTTSDFQPLAAPNLNKTLIVVNSNTSTNTLSTSVADWYAAARNLDGGVPGDYYWVSFDFGTGRLATSYGDAIADIAAPYKLINSASSPIVCTGVSAKCGRNDVVGFGVTKTISELVATNGIHCILVTPGVPSGVTGYPVQFGQFPHATEVYLSLVARLKEAATNTGISSSYQFGTHSNPTILTPEATRTLPASRSLDVARPMWGRIGWVELGYNEVFSTLAQVQTIVNNAITNEAIANKSKLHILGGTAYIYGGGTVNSLATNYVGAASGFTNYGHIDTPTDYGNTLDSQPGALNDERDYWATKPAWASATPKAEYYLSGTNRQWLQLAGGGLVQPFAVVSPRLDPELTTTYSDRCTFQSGGWAYSWMSAAYNMGLFSLKNGASMSFLVTSEPGAIGLADSDAMLKALSLGYSGAEAVYRCPAKLIGPTQNNITNAGYLHGVTTVWGDPLYRPYLTA
jgi:hypothetical protein